MGEIYFISMASRMGGGTAPRKNCRLMCTASEKFTLYTISMAFAQDIFRQYMLFFCDVNRSAPAAWPDFWETTTGISALFISIPPLADALIVPNGRVPPNVPNTSSAQGKTGGAQAQYVISLNKQKIRTCSQQGTSSDVFCMVDDIGLDCRIALRGNPEGCRQFLYWWRQLSTGQLHSDGFESQNRNAIPNKKAHPYGWVFLFGGRYRTRTYDLPHVKRML